MKGGENMNEITTLISTLGFPIVCCVFMWRYINTTLKEFTKTMTENTALLQKLIDKLDDKRG